MLQLVYFTSILLTCALTGFLAWYAWRRRGAPGAHLYAGVALGECLLALAEILSMLSPTQALAFFWFRVRFIFTAAIPVFWMAFALEYSGQKDWLTKRLLAALFVVPFITQVMIWSNSLYGLWAKQEIGFAQNGPFWLADIGARSPGLWYLVHSFYSLLLLLAGTIVIVAAAWKRNRLYKIQASLLAAGAFIVLGVSLVSAFNLIPQAGFNPFVPAIGVSALIYLLAVIRFQFLQRAPAEKGAPSAAASLKVQEKRSAALFLFILLLLASGIGAIAYLSYQHYERQFRAQAESQLASIAELKIAELQDWRSERLAEAEILYRNPAFSALVQHFLENPDDAQTQSELRAWLDKYQAFEQYDRVFLLDTNGVERISSPAAPEPVAAHLTEALSTILASNQVTLMDFHQDTPGGPIRLALLIPIYSEPGNLPLGVLVLRIDPQVYLYPYLQEWPVPSGSAETLLVRREGNDILFLNGLRFQNGAALNLRFPLDNTQLPAVKAALGQTGIVEGSDYRGAPVAAYVLPVPDSPWFLVAKVDTSELSAPLRERLWETLAFFGSLILACGAGLTLVWRRQRLRYYRNQAETAQALRESQRLLQDVTDNSTTLIYTLDIDGKFMLINRSLEAVLGVPRQGLIGKTREGILPPEIASAHRTNDLEVINNQQAITFEEENDESDGKHVYLSIKFPLLDPQGVVYGVGGISTDITERKKAEEALRESEVRFRATFEQAAVGIAHVSPEGRFLRLNQRFCDIVGYTHAEMLTLTFQDLTHPDDLEADLAYVRQVLAGEIETYSMEKRYVRKDKVLVWVNLTVSLVRGPSGQPKYFIAVVEDITRRKQAEESRQRYARRLEGMQTIDRAILAVESPEEIARAALPRLRNLIPCQRANVVIFDFERGLARFAAVEMDGDLGPAAETEMPVAEFSPLEVLQRGPVSYVKDLEAYHPRPAVLNTLLEKGIRCFMTAPMVVEGKLLGELNLAATKAAAFDAEHIEIAREVADQLAVAMQQAHLRQELESHAEELEERVKERTAQLEAANKELEAFTYSVSHDLRAPLRAMDGFSRILIEEYGTQLEEETKHYLQLVRENTQQMGHLVEDLLALSRLGRQALRVENVSMAGIVEAALEELHAEQESRKVEIAIGNLPNCQADPTLLKQVFVNLLSNALKFSRKRKLARIEVGWLPHPQRLSQGERRVNLPLPSGKGRDEGIYFVRDNGVGFDMQYTDKLFGVFQRLHRAEEYEGTGVGLAIVQRIIRRHGGRIWAEAEVDKGATFYFTL